MLLVRCCTGTDFPYNIAEPVTEVESQEQEQLKTGESTPTVPGTPMLSDSELPTHGSEQEDETPTTRVQPQGEDIPMTEVKV